MANTDSFIMMGVGGFFLLLSIIFFLWYRSEERGLNNSLSQLPDLREFMTRWPMRVEPGALKVGGAIFMALGAVLIILGVVFLAID